MWFPATTTRISRSPSIILRGSAPMNPEADPSGLRATKELIVPSFHGLRKYSSSKYAFRESEAGSLPVRNVRMKRAATAGMFAGTNFCISLIIDNVPNAHSK